MSRELTQAAGPWNTDLLGAALTVATRTLVGIGSTVIRLIDEPTWVGGAARHLRPSPTEGPHA
jgi:hypothetical protein